MIPQIPESCIRGPELHDPAQIRQEIANAAVAALESYHDGTARLLRVRALLAAEARLAELRQTREFLQSQLATLKRQRPRAFAAARAAFIREQREGSQ